MGPPSAYHSGMLPEEYRENPEIAVPASVVDAAKGRDEALEEAIDEELLFQEAEKRGLVPSAAEAREVFAGVLEAAKRDEVSARVVADYLAGLGMSGDKYLHHPVVIEKYRRFLAWERLGQELFGDA